MKKLMLVILLCCSVTGVSYAQQSSDNKSTKTEKITCTSSEKGVTVDAGGVHAGDITREVSCEKTTETPSREKKETPSGGKRKG
jgi:hypothetical protein